MLTYYFDRRGRRRDRREDQAESERVRREERAEAERVRQEYRAEAERRHQETMTALTGTLTALTAILERNGHSDPTDQSEAVARLQQRVAELEAEITLLRNGNGESSEG